MKVIPLTSRRGVDLQGRFWVQLISSSAFREYMKHRDHTVRSLADAVDAETAKQAKKDRTVRATKSRVIIGFLRSGKRNTCQPNTAAAIEKCLGAPPGSLFVPQVSHVSQDARRAA